MMEFSILYFLNLAWRRIWALLAAFIVAAGFAFCYCQFIATPKYTAKASILVTNGGSISGDAATGNSQSVSNSDIAASVNMITTVVDILNTTEIYKQLSDSMDGAYSYRQLMSMAKVASRSDKTMFIDVAFSASSGEEAVKLANSFVRLAPKYISDPIPNSLTKYYTTENASKTYPLTARTTVVAGFVGVIVMYAAVWCLDLLDRAIKGEEDFTTRFNIPLLGTVPDFESVTTSGDYHAARGGNDR